MLLTRAIALLPILAAAIVADDLIPVSPYIGKHKSNCNSVRKLTGTLVDGKIYTFGGCYTIPYIVDPDEEGGMFQNMEDHQNVTESSYAYSISTDEWSFETNTPRPLQGASITAIGKDIYLYNIQSKPRTSQLNLWKFETNTKSWTELPQLPFLKHGNLLTCHNNGKMYFMGSGDGHQRNIIHVHDLATNDWQDPIYLDKRINAKRIICHDTHISMVGEQVQDDRELVLDFGREQEYTQKLINSYYNGTVHVVENFNITLGTCRFSGRAQITHLNEWFYTFVVGAAKNETSITKINTLTLETVKLNILPYALSDVLILPTENDEIYLFGGRKDRRGFSNTSKNQKGDQNHRPLPQIKTYNHKLKISVQDVVEESLRTREKKQEYHFNLQVPNN
ncbi:hypothetical protein [Parasitella parasitica]|uniref:Galactose oxidase n=1 Tax=Parasitella parasitica TaxID=35722 RepID=A0A0B7MVT4_9FUNG|nr:hypothetical protein [Parasitella parasitica]